MASERKEANEIYKLTTTFLAGVVMSGASAWFLYPRNAITKDDLEKTIPAMVMANNPYISDAKNITTEIQVLHDEQIRQGAQINQMAVDIGRISEKIGVSAHPSEEKSK